MDLPDDEDGDAMRRVIEEGSDPTRPMTIDFQIDCPDLASAEAIAIEIPNDEFTTSIYQDPEDDSVTCECSREMLLDHPELIRIQRQLTEIADPFGGCCDAWATVGNAQRAASINDGPTSPLERGPLDSGPEPTKTCVFCHHENPVDAAQCHECEVTFAPNQNVSRPSDLDSADNPVRVAATKNMAWGAFWCIVGALLTALSYATAASTPGGGTYIVAWGAIVFGAFQFFRGRSVRDANPTKDDIAYEALIYGSRLESEGRNREAFAVYRTIMEKFPQSDASQDARKSIEGLQSRLN